LTSSVVPLKIRPMVILDQLMKPKSQMWWAHDDLFGVQKRYGRRRLVEPVKLITVPESLKIKLISAKRVHVPFILKEWDGNKEEEWDGLTTSWKNYVAGAGPQRPPYDLMWVEYPFPVLIENEQYVYGVLIQYKQEITAFTLRLFTARIEGSSHKFSLPELTNFTYAIHLDEYGNMSGHGAASLNCDDELLNGTGLGGMMPAPVASYLYQLHPTALAIGLMNCKNVSLLQHERKSRSSNKVTRRRKRPENLSYHTIELPRKNSDPESITYCPDHLKALHTVRGHFKTYTADAPRLGRLSDDVGTFWTPWHLRGNEEFGRILSDYEVN